MFSDDPNSISVVMITDDQTSIRKESESMINQIHFLNQKISITDANSEIIIHNLITKANEDFEIITHIINSNPTNETHGKFKYMAIENKLHSPIELTEEEVHKRNKKKIFWIVLISIIILSSIIVLSVIISINP